MSQDVSTDVLLMWQLLCYAYVQLQFLLFQNNSIIHKDQKNIVHLYSQSLSLSLSLSLCLSPPLSFLSFLPLLPLSL